MRHEDESGKGKYENENITNFHRDEEVKKLKF